MISYNIKETDENSGIYIVTISCQRFYESFYEKYGKDITKENCSLTGIVYIYPEEWGDSYSAISSTEWKNRDIIKIEIQYRNGSLRNPYLLETADDLKEIELNSNYEIASTIDTVFLPLNINSL